MLSSVRGELHGREGTKEGYRREQQLEEPWRSKGYGVWSVAALLCFFWAVPTRLAGMSVVAGGQKRTK